MNGFGTPSPTAMAAMTAKITVPTTWADHLEADAQSRLPTIRRVRLGD